MARTFSDGVEGQPGAAPVSTLASGIAIGAVSSTVQAGHGARLPATGDFSIRFEDATDETHFENVTASARSTDTITHGATTYAWDAGDKVIHVISKTDLDAFAETADLASYQALSVIDAEGDLFIGTGDNTTARKAIGSDFQLFRTRAAATNKAEWATLATGAAVAANEATTSTTFTDLTTAGPAVTVTTGTSVLIIPTADLYNSADGNYGLMSYAVSGATTIAADAHTNLLIFTSPGAGKDAQVSAAYIHSGLTPGSNTFTAKYRVNAGTGNFLRRGITIIPI